MAKDAQTCAGECSVTMRLSVIDKCFRVIEMGPFLIPREYKNSH
jgi:hypothetical protein